MDNKISQIINKLDSSREINKQLQSLLTESENA
jgi:hypothetical protein